MESATEKYPAYALPPRTARPARARTGLVVFVAVLTELVIIAAADNQWVSSQLVKAQERTNHVGLRLLEGSWLTYTWRFTPRSGLTDTWWSELALILTVLVVSGLLVAAVVGGPVTFARAFFGTWTAVIVASLLGAFVRGLIDRASTTPMPGVDRVTRAAFGGPSGSVAVAALGFGLVVALVTAAVAVTTRRKAEPGMDRWTESGPSSAQPDQPPPFFGTPAAAPEPSGMRPWQDQHYGPPPARQASSAAPARTGDAQETSRLPSVPPPGEPAKRGPDVSPQGDQPTTQIPRQAEGDRPTTQYPRPPEDEL
jgi:hypothetical protein